VHGELVLVDMVQQQHDWSAPADNQRREKWDAVLRVDNRFDPAPVA
jgi:hypothetical protein